MRITAVEEYGLRCLLALARKGPHEQLSISEIAELEGLSVPYASKLLAILRRAGLVLAARGRGGGFSIAKEPAQINMYEALTALGGPLVDPNHCQKYAGQLEKCVHSDNCAVRDLLGGLAGYVQAFLAQTSLQDILNSESREPLKQIDRMCISTKALEEELARVPDTMQLDG